MKSLFIVCDGLGDRLTNGKTPLEAAKTPNMDLLAMNGITGIMDPVRAGIRPGSDTSHLSLFGYDPFKLYTGRGPFEAAGAGIKLKEGDIACRCNFASMRNGRITDRRAGREEEGLDQLSKAVEKIKIDGVKLIFKRCQGHRAVLVVRGKGLSPRITDTDPEETGVPPAKSKPIDGKKDSVKTADILNEFTRKTIEILSDHPVNSKRTGNGKPPANVVLCRGTGINPHLEPFKKKYGMKGVCICATTLIAGVCRAIGMDTLDVKGANGHTDSDIGAKAKAAIGALKKYDFVFLHIKGADEASHDGNFQAKREFIERIDREVIALVLEEVKDTTVILTADHSTPISIRQHSADPVPIAILGDVRTDSVKKFTERDCAKGGLGRICGINLMGIILDLGNDAELFGA
ncbi:MAG: 2,3-bisphosphoglycerate-independent phosphoglycerate mutase [Candidatus Altiarchaeales archaeon]|nr:2,3-bisphosphoglycerate-independent phosphoglycerate mutase [Candidatus Altiarchaeota archaeon]MCG2782849.1 2,3-bisphosphoglycerate-independent phosphoglycerate mutase [Candidatus Altiarchaeales archaeon]MBU4266975.1 2,3-bisphosphoglycerate-independent phosphoglycerate mutase [Candidatus Altiarchaeota archaeon]MBU4342133.1 2,3-bisphosphoglycerate-independent phosphoglycerate mutase [Candidatus Altiarchaeota archaeon]MBU4406396.1 2,3-bisphosphoglycerate-independent phosphoglycerate mutase [Ca